MFFGVVLVVFSFWRIWLQWGVDWTQGTHKDGQVRWIPFMWNRSFAIAFSITSSGYLYECLFEAPEILARTAERIPWLSRYDTLMDPRSLKALTLRATPDTQLARANRAFKAVTQVSRACISNFNFRILEFECDFRRGSKSHQVSKFPTALRNHFEILRGSFLAVSTPMFASKISKY